jgi:predicted RNA-binding Zn-ribbon protein involved in translation (DUF1610 family)
MRPIHRHDGWVLGTCMVCGTHNYVEPHGTTADCPKCGVWRVHNNIPYAQRDVAGMFMVRRAAVTP